MSGDQRRNITVVLDGMVGPQVSPPPDDVERTATGIPIRLIWLPYVGFTLVMLGLMCLSFFHYHRKNGHKYRRRAELMRQFNSNITPTDIVSTTQFPQGSTPTNGGFSITPEQPPLTPIPPVNPYHHRPPKQNPHFQPSTSANAIEATEVYTVRRKAQQVPTTEEPLQRQSSLFRQISGPPGAKPNKHEKQPAYSPRGVPLESPPKPIQPPPPHPPPQYPPCTTTTTSRHGRASDYGSGGTTSASSSSNARRHKRPLVFTSNLNGSMVDIRCGVNESHKTFRSKCNRSTSLPSTSLPSTSIWTLPHLSSRAYHHHHHHGGGPPHSAPAMSDASAQTMPQYPDDGGQHHHHHHHYGGGGGGYPTRRDMDYEAGVPFSPSGGGLSSIMSDCEDDEVFLLHQTKL